MSRFGRASSVTGNHKRQSTHQSKVDSLQEPTHNIPSATCAGCSTMSYAPGPGMSLPLTSAYRPLIVTPPLRCSGMSAPQKPEIYNGCYPLERGRRTAKDEPIWGCLIQSRPHGWETSWGYITLVKQGPQTHLTVHPGPCVHRPQAPARHPPGALGADPPC